MADDKMVFLFLELFSSEGGIQAYNQKLLTTYLDVIPDLEGDVLVLRDDVGVKSGNPMEGSKLRFHYLKGRSPQLDRVKMLIILMGLLFTKRPKMVFCGHVNLAVMVGWICFWLGIRYKVITYGKEIWSGLSLPYKMALNYADAIWTISRYSRDRACLVNGLDQSKFVILPCGVDEDLFQPKSKNSALQAKYQLEGCEVLLTVARLWSGDVYKGVDVTIQALPLILVRFPRVRYVVVGRGDDQARLAKLADDLGVASQVVFAGFVPSEELGDYYRLADAYVMPSQEGFGIVYLEAMCCGVPVVSGDDDGSADPLQDGRLGWRVPYRDPGAVARAVIEILIGEDQRCQGDWLREQVISGFGKEAFKLRLTDLVK